MSARRLPEGGRIDRARPLDMRFDGRPLAGFAGDTLASALIASGERIVARSFKYHRPRGVMGAGVEEANAIVDLGEGDRAEPNTRATTIEAFDGLRAHGQNAWPSVRHDVMAANGLGAPVFKAGFYYKTFIGPFSGTRFWMACERLIRRAAGMGRASGLRDPDSYETRTRHCDLLVVGGGAAGLHAAFAAARKGEDVVLAEQDFELGGHLLSVPGAWTWLDGAGAALAGLPKLRVLTRTTVFGAYDHGTYGAIERLTDHASTRAGPRARLWSIKATRCVVATGAIEQPAVLPGNDRPGVMLASALLTYIDRYAVLPGARIVVASANDTAAAASVSAARAGAAVIHCDARADLPAAMRQRLEAAGVEVLAGTRPVRAVGRCVLRAVVLEGPGGRRRVACDVLATSAGWAPALHLWSQRHGRPVWDAEQGVFRVRPEAGADMDVVGAAALAPVAAAEAGLPPLPEMGFDAGLSGLGGLPAVTGKMAFVDLQHDVTTDDVDLAQAEGYRSVEHTKRYTTAGMATDQGKTASLAVLDRIASLRGSDAGAVGTTTFRPPYTPVPIGALVGARHGNHYEPTRLSPLHSVHEAARAVMTQAGLWLRPWYYPADGETLETAHLREAAQVRRGVGMVDVSTLGKIAVQGPDGAEFLNRVYVNGFAKLPVGRIRYGVMLREDGIVLDDGTVARLGEDEWFMTTTTANAGRVLSHLEYLLQVAWPDLRVHVTSLTDREGAMAVAGPRAREVLARVVKGADLSAAALPNNHLARGSVEDRPVRIHRTSFSGELAFEIYAGSADAADVWRAIAGAGEPDRIVLYGTEAMAVLRIEKGHVAGPELDGRTTLDDLGLGRMASRSKSFVGSALREREGLRNPGRRTLVGLRIDGAAGAAPGMLIFPEGSTPAGHGDGHVTSTAQSEALGRPVALGLLSNGPARHGERVRLVDLLGGRALSAEVVAPVMLDPEGRRMDA